MKCVSDFVFSSVESPQVGKRFAADLQPSDNTAVCHVTVWKPLFLYYVSICFYNTGTDYNSDQKTKKKFWKLGNCNIFNGAAEGA